MDGRGVKLENTILALKSSHKIAQASACAYIIDRHLIQFINFY